jgi:hypothetical protein
LHPIGTYQFAVVLVTNDQVMALIVIGIRVPLRFVTFIEAFPHLEIKNLEAETLNLLEFLTGTCEIRHIVTGSEVRVFRKTFRMDRIIERHKIKLSNPMNISRFFYPDTVPQKFFSGLLS